MKNLLISLSVILLGSCSMLVEERTEVDLDFTHVEQYEWESRDTFYYPVYITFHFDAEKTQFIRTETEQQSSGERVRYDVYRYDVTELGPQLYEFTFWERHTDNPNVHESTLRIIDQDSLQFDWGHSLIYTRME